MKLLEKNEYSFKAQSDKFIGYNAFKCNLMEEGFNPYDLYFNIDKVHLKPFFETTDNDMMIGEYGKLRDYESSDYNFDDVKLTMVFNLNGIFFEAGYCINIACGIVEFNMENPLFIKDEFVMPPDMDTGLMELINDKLKSVEKLISVNDERFDSYFSNKYLPVFINFVEYMESLASVDKCKECIHVFNYNLNNSDGCKELFVRNRYNSGEKSDETD